MSQYLGECVDIAPCDHLTTIAWVWLVIMPTLVCIFFACFCFPSPEEYAQYLQDMDKQKNVEADEEFINDEESLRELSFSTEPMHILFYGSDEDEEKEDSEVVVAAMERNASIFPDQAYASKDSPILSPFHSC